MARHDTVRQILPGRVAVNAGRATVTDLFAKALGHDFHHASLLQAALTHPSSPFPVSADTPGFERLEFLGDRVLGLVIAELLLDRYPDEDEGALSRRHVALVRREALVDVARAIGVDGVLLTAPGGHHGVAVANPSILADTIEAIIAALYLDGGFDVAADFVRRHWIPLMESARMPPRDAKTTLQEWAQARGRALPSYAVLSSEGPAHEPVFTVEVRVEGEASAVGSGPSKRIAEQAAAETLLRELEATFGR